MSVYKSRPIPHICLLDTSTGQLEGELPLVIHDSFYILSNLKIKTEINVNTKNVAP